jgi:hypothetical protein
MLDFSFDMHVYCHDLINPPSQSGRCSVEMRLISSKGLITIERVETKSAESIYLMTIPSGHNLGFTSGEQYVLENEFRNLVLAFNLTQERICINYKGGDFQPYKVTPKVPESRTTVTKSDGGVHIETEETIAVRDESHITINIWGKIDEEKAANIFQKIQKLKRFEKKDVSERQAMNLSDALTKYESGISEFDRLVKFKHFFNSLELVTNMSKEFKGDALDSEVERISSVSKSEAKLETILQQD